MWLKRIKMARFEYWPVEIFGYEGPEIELGHYPLGSWCTSIHHDPAGLVDNPKDWEEPKEQKRGWLPQKATKITKGRRQVALKAGRLRF